MTENSLMRLVEMIIELKPNNTPLVDDLMRRFDMCKDGGAEEKKWILSKDTTRDQLEEQGFQFATMQKILRIIASYNDSKESKS